MSHIMRKTIGTLFIAMFLMALGAPAMAAPRRQTTLRLDGLHLQMTAKKLRRLQRTVRRVKGVRWAKVDLATGELFVGHARRVSKKRLERAVERIGFDVVTPTVHAQVDAAARPRG
ncbi:MAG: heavy metal-associated domain-containing protein [Deltaproteobacteria bacterium]